jgi:sugar lactone lactonase YvrE
MREAAVIFEARNIVGESIIWSPAEAALYWVDIVGSAIHRLDPATGAHRQWATPELPTSVGLRRGGGFIVGLRQRVALWSPGGTFATFAVPEPDKPGNRLNEGVVAPDGSFWVGTMQDNIGSDGGPKPAPDRTGRLYRISAEGKVTALSPERFGITNTMVWLDDGSFVTADTVTNSLFRFDYDPVALTLANPRPFASSLPRGLPDGSTRDTAGAVYNCRVAGGAGIARIDPAGDVEMIELPVRSPTSCTFGGPQLQTLYVTSARFGMSEAEVATHPLEGALLAIPFSVQGKRSSTFAG